MAEAWQGNLSPDEGLLEPSGDFPRFLPATTHLPGEDAFRDWRSKGAHLAELLRYARVRPLADPGRQQSLGL